MDFDDKKVSNDIINNAAMSVLSSSAASSASFLNASLHHCKRVCPSIRPFVCPSVCLLTIMQNRRKPLNYPKNIAIAHRSTTDASICPLGLLCSFLLCSTILSWNKNIESHWCPKANAFFDTYFVRPYVRSSIPMSVGNSDKLLHWR